MDNWGKYDEDDEDDDEEEIIDDELLAEITEYLKREEQECIVPDKERENEVRLAERIARYIAHGDGVRVECEIGKPAPYMAYISIIGKKIVLDNPLLFEKLSGIATNVGIYQLLNGEIHIEFTFYGIKKRVGE